MAFRVPTPDVSVVDLTVRLEKKVCVYAMMHLTMVDCEHPVITGLVRGDQEGNKGGLSVSAAEGVHCLH